MTDIYVIGALKNPKVNEVANALRGEGWDVFDDWMAPGPETDSYWKAYELQRGRTYREALEGPHAKTVFNFDHHYLNEAKCVVLVMPAGRSGFLELGWALGQGKPGYVLLEEDPERWDVMVQFATGVVSSLEELSVKLAANFGGNDVT